MSHSLSAVNSNSHDWLEASQDNTSWTDADCKTATEMVNALRAPAMADQRVRRTVEAKLGQIREKTGKDYG